MSTFSVLVSVFFAILVLFCLLYAVVSWLVGAPRQDGQADKRMSELEALSPPPPHHS